jgi:hypothetical protein
MKKIWISLVMISIVSLLFTTEIFSQRGMRQKGNNRWGQKSAFNKMYNPKTVETIKGEVVSIDTVTPMKGKSYGIHLMVKTGKGTISIHVGPAWYFDKQNFVIRAKDKIKVRGSRITFDGKPAIIAAELKKGNEVIKLRDENGYPVWSGRRK